MTYDFPAQDKTKVWFSGVNVENHKPQETKSLMVNTVRFLMSLCGRKKGHHHSMHTSNSEGRATITSNRNKMQNWVLYKATKNKVLWKCSQCLFTFKSEGLKLSSCRKTLLILRLFLIVFPQRLHLQTRTNIQHKSNPADTHIHTLGYSTRKSLNSKLNWWIWALYSTGFFSVFSAVSQNISLETVWTGALVKKILQIKTEIKEMWSIFSSANSPMEFSILLWLLCFSKLVFSHHEHLQCITSYL